MGNCECISRKEIKDSGLANRPSQMSLGQKDNTQNLYNSDLSD